MAIAGAATANGKLEEPDHSSSNWYFSREDIEKRSPSRLDGVDLKKETYFRKSYCTFLQDLGMCLKVPQVTIATAIVFSHRFFLRQSHLKNDRHLIATICMFLAGKVEETPRPLRDVILMSYEIRHKKDPIAVARIKQKEVYEEQKELVLVGERLVLTTLGFDLNILHPYKPLVAGIKKLKVAQNALAQVAWNFVNDGLRTSLCLQFKPHHIAAGAIFLAAKFLKVKLPQDGDKVWWQEFEVTPRQLEEVSNQMLELYEQNKTFGTAAASASRSCDPSSSVVTVGRAKGQDAAVPSANGTHWNQISANTVGADKSDKHAHAAKADDAVTSSRREEMYEVSAIHVPSAYDVQENGHVATVYEPAHANGFVPVPLAASAESSGIAKSGLSGQVKHVGKKEVREHSSNVFEDGQIKEEVQEKKASTDIRVKLEPGQGTTGATSFLSSLTSISTGSAVERREVGNVDLKVTSFKVKVENEDEEPKRPRSTNLEDVNTDRVKALAQKRRQSKGEGGDAKLITAKAEMEVTDEEELLERELESGVEAAAEAEKVKQERREAKTKSSQKVDHDFVGGNREGADDGDAGSKRRKFIEEDVNQQKRTKSSERGDRVDWVDGEGRPGVDRAEDGELPSFSHAHDQPRSPRPLDRKPAPPGSHEKNSNASSSKRHRERRDAHRDGHRDAHRDARVTHGSRDRDNYQRDHHHQYRPDGGERERHYYKERDYQDRDHKKLRTHELHGS